MKVKQSRWYKIEYRKAYVYETATPTKKDHVSVVGIEDLTYYRKEFDLKHVDKTRAV